jgi:periplasmic divalent cation tolerance protein
VLFKTAADKVEAAMARIAELHCYDIPAILSWQAENVHTPFSDWVSHQLHK